jgi:hypothetical protein
MAREYENPIEHERVSEKRDLLSRLQDQYGLETADLLILGRVIDEMQRENGTARFDERLYERISQYGYEGAEKENRRMAVESGYERVTVGRELDLPDETRKGQEMISRAVLGENRHEE